MYSVCAEWPCVYSVCTECPCVYSVCAEWSCVYSVCGLECIYSRYVYTKMSNRDEVHTPHIGEAAALESTVRTQCIASILFN